MKSLWIPFVLLLPLAVWAQPPTLWERLYLQTDMEEASTLQQTPDGGFMMAGTVEFGGDSSVAFVRKTDAHGLEQWQRRYSWDTNTWCKEAIVTRDSAYVLMGDQFYHDQSTFVAKLNAMGDTLWKRNIRSASTFYTDFVGGLIETANGFILGGQGSEASQSGAVWLLLDDSGNIAHRGFFGGRYMMGLETSVITEIASVGNGDYLLAGWCQPWRSDTFDLPDEGLLIRINTAGDTLWTRRFRAGSDPVEFHAICRTADGNFICGGPRNEGWIYLVKVNAQGDLLWARTLPPYSEGDAFLSLSSTTDGGCAAVAQTRSEMGNDQAYLLRMSAEGDTLWHRCWGDSGRWRGDGLQVRPNGEYAVLAHVELYGPTYSDISFLTLMAADTASGVDPNDHPLVGSFGLMQNYPNPFNPSTEIAFELPRSMNATLKVFDVLGKEVAVLEDGRLGAGEHVVSFDGSRLASGVYFCRLAAGENVQTRKMLLLK